MENLKILRFQVAPETAESEAEDRAQNQAILTEAQAGLAQPLPILELEAVKR